MIRSDADLDHEARRLLAQADAEYAPSAADRARVHARVLRSLAGVPVSVPSAGHETVDQVADAASKGASGWALGASVKGLIGAMAIGSACFGAGFFAGRQTAPLVAQSGQPLPTHTRAPAHSPAPAPKPASPAPGPQPQDLTNVARSAPKGAPARAASAAVPARDAPLAPLGLNTDKESAAPLDVHTSALWQETQLLQRAQRALGAGNPQLARALLDELDDQFPNGVLLEERRAARVLVLCGLGRVAEARAQAQQFRSAYPTSVHAERVGASCAGDVAHHELDSTTTPQPAQP